MKRLKRRLSVLLTAIAAIGLLAFFQSRSNSELLPE